MSSVPGPAAAARMSVEETAWLAKRSRVDVQTGCREWVGSSRVRFRRQRWRPARLLYALQGHEHAEAMQGKLLQPTCATPGCIAPAHQRITTPVPPRPVAGTGLGKRKTTSASAADVKRARIMAKVREELWKLQAKLANLEAAPPTDDVPAVWVDGTSETDALARAREIDADPFGYVLGRL